MKYRSETAAIPCARASSVSIRSIASFVFPYVFTGTLGVSSVMSSTSGSPYVAAVEEKTIRLTSAARIASSRFSAPSTFPRQYCSGTSWDSPTSESAAKCSTPSNPRATTSFTASASSRSTSTKSAPSGTAPRWPL